MKKYAVVYEWAGSNWAAHSPDVDGVISTGATLEEVAANFKEALEFHLEGMVEDGDPVPEPTTQVGYVEVQIPAAVA